MHHLEKIMYNNMFEKDSFVGFDKRPNVAPSLKPFIVKPTFEIFKTQDFVHYGRYRKNEKYKEAREESDNYLGIDNWKFWIKWIMQIADERKCSIYDVVTMAAMPRLLSKIREKKHRELGKIGLAYRFATVLGEPFIPVFTEQELIDTQPPAELYDKVVKNKTKKSLKPHEYGKVKYSGYLSYLINMKKRKVQWRG